MTDDELIQILREKFPEDKTPYEPDANWWLVLPDLLDIMRRVAKVASRTKVAPPERDLCERLRSSALDFRDWNWDLYKMLIDAAEAIEWEQQNFADGLEAWKVNNAHFAGRVHDLEEQLRVGVIHE